MKNLTIIIPCYNEVESINELINQIKSSLLKCQFLLIDNGSQDDTASILKNILLPSNIKVIFKKKNTGYGAGIKYGFNYVKTSLVGWMHADLQQEIDLINSAKPLINSLNEKKNTKFLAVKGRRSSRSFIDNFFTIGVSLLASVVFLRRCWDIAGQPNIFRVSDINFIKDAPNDHTFEFYIYLKFKLNNGTFLRFDAPFLKRRYGKSSWENGLKSKIDHSFKIFSFILKFKLSNLISKF